MCIIGNPPYAVSSTNKNPWIDNLISDYKKNLNEKSYNSLSDDYVKFIKYGQHFVDKNGSGILAYISNNSFIDGIVFRQMRNNLLESFDKIYILDLHGNSKKKEISPDGSTDQNVFNIMQGVSINIFVKTGKKKKNKLGELSHFDLFGKREAKYKYLKENSIQSIGWNKLKNESPNFFFVKKDFEGAKHYETGFKTDNLFPIYTSGIKTHKDKELISSTKYGVNNKTYFYRPFDTQNIDYDLNKVVRHRFSVMKNLLHNNIAILFPRQAITGNFGFFVSKGLTDINYTGTAGQFGAGLTFPLYLYPETNDQQTLEQKAERKPNLNKEIVNEIAEKLGLTFTNEKEASKNTFAPIDILDYIYAVLHSTKYREKYKEFLKIDFPKVPYPKDKNTFWELVKLGGEIRKIHLLESPKVEDYITTYPKDGSNKITTKIGKKDWELFDEENQLGRIWINDAQYFDNIPLTAWEFYIGGYRPAQKWLKDRKERTLDFEDILHYQKIIVALSETDRLMKAIDKVEIEVKFVNYSLTKDG